VENEIFAASLKAGYLLPYQVLAKFFGRRLAYQFGVEDCNFGESPADYMGIKFVSYGFYFGQFRHCLIATFVVILLTGHLYFSLKRLYVKHLLAIISGKTATFFLIEVET